MYLSIKHITCFNILLAVFRSVIYLHFPFLSILLFFFLRLIKANFGSNSKPWLLNIDKRLV